MVDKRTLTEEDIKRLFITKAITKEKKTSSVCLSQKPSPRQDGQTTK